MKRVFEFAPFLVTAVAVHAWAFGAFPGGASSAGGEGGQQQVTLHGASGDIAELVADWVRPPQVSPEISAQATLAEPSQKAPEVPQMDVPVQSHLPDLPTPSTAPDLPQIAHAPAAPTPRPKARPEKPRAAQAPAQRASGSGGQASAGTGGRAQDAARSGVDQAGLIAQWGGAIRTAVLRNQRPPPGRASGTVHLRVSVQANGQLAGVAIRQSSGHAALDAAAVAAVQRARLPAAPKGLSGTQHFNLPVSFKG